MFLIIGLGNPGFRYRFTRHNVGFMVLDLLAKKYRCRFQSESLFLIGDSMQKGEKLFLSKPMTYMNRSGDAVFSLVKRFSLPLSQMLVLCDDLNLPLGKIRIRKKGSHGGQKGLDSIINMLDDDSFPRLRLGSGFNQKNDTAKYVLSSFRFQEKKKVRKMIKTASQAVEDFMFHGIDWTMNEYN